MPNSINPFSLKFIVLQWGHVYLKLMWGPPRPPLLLLKHLQAFPYKGIPIFVTSQVYVLIQCPFSSISLFISNMTVIDPLIHWNQSFDPFLLPPFRGKGPWRGGRNSTHRYQLGLQVVICGSLHCRGRYMHNCYVVYTPAQNPLTLNTWSASLWYWIYCNCDFTEFSNNINLNLVRFHSDVNFFLWRIFLGKTEVSL